MNFGKKYLGKRLKDIPRKDIESYVDRLEKMAKEKKAAPGYEVEMLKSSVARFHNPDRYVREAIELPASARHGLWNTG